MNTTDLFLPSTPRAARAYVLTHLDLYDWGAFGGRHCAEIDTQGTAIIGPTGSGKTTLVDALMTLLTASPRYNLASSGGHESDRDLVSYIRGVSGAGNNSGNNEHIARSGKTVTGIAARFSNGKEPVTIGAIFWLDGSSSASADLKRLWFFSQEPAQTLVGNPRVRRCPGIETAGKRYPGHACVRQQASLSGAAAEFFRSGRERVHFAQPRCRDEANRQH
jgi:energy-coupling factor transporter ATP-binding protein EcfA2